MNASPPLNIHSPTPPVLTRGIELFAKPKPGGKPKPGPVCDLDLKWFPGAQAKRDQAISMFAQRVDQRARYSYFLHVRVSDGVAPRNYLLKVSNAESTVECFS
jgi:hypothetical protein